MKSKTIILFTCFIFIPMTNIFAQKDTANVLSVNFKGVTLEQALDSLSAITGYYFIYDVAEINVDKKLNIIFENTRLDIILYSILDKNTEINKHGKNIVIKRKLSTKQEKTNIIISGTVKSYGSDEKLPFVNISLSYKPIGTISNAEGKFSFVIKPEYKNDTILISHIGYKTAKIPVSEIKNNTDTTIFLQKYYYKLKEVFVKYQDPNDIILKTQMNIARNYILRQHKITAFYREGVVRSDRYLTYSEAVIDVVRSEYGKSVKVIKSRKFTQIESDDSVLVKIKAGINGCLSIDLIYASLPFLISPGYCYRYRYAGLTTYDGVSVYKIAFKPNSCKQLMYKGYMYINAEDYSVIEAEYCISDKYIRKYNNLFIVKRSNKYTVKLKQACYRVSYSGFGKKLGIKHARADLTFEVIGKKSTEKSEYKIFIELATLKLQKSGYKKIKFSEQFRTDKIFFDHETHYDPDFWQGMKIIPPEASLEKALLNINSKIDELED